MSCRREEGHPMLEQAPEVRGKHVLLSAVVHPMDRILHSNIQRHHFGREYYIQKFETTGLAWLAT